MDCVGDYYLVIKGDTESLDCTLTWGRVKIWCPCLGVLILTLCRHVQHRATGHRASQNTGLRDLRIF